MRRRRAVPPWRIRHPAPPGYCRRAASKAATTAPPARGMSRVAPSPPPGLLRDRSTRRMPSPRSSWRPTRSSKRPCRHLMHIQAGTRWFRAGAKGPSLIVSAGHKRFFSSSVRLTCKPALACENTLLQPLNSSSRWTSCSH